MKTHTEIVKFAIKEQPGAAPAGMKTGQTGKAHPSNLRHSFFYKAKLTSDDRVLVVSKPVHPVTIFESIFLNSAPCKTAWATHNLFITHTI